MHTSTTLASYVIVLLMALTQNLPGQVLNDPLNEYIRLALEHNGSIKEQQAWVNEKKAGVAVAKKLWSPEISFGGNYTLAAGGRSIGFPIGDLLNPISSELNRITQTSRFPTLENQKIQFLPNNFYDLRARLTQPILRPEIKTNQLLKEEQVHQQEIQTRITGRDLIRDVKKAYYQYIQAGKMIDILKQSLVILDESERISRSMITNGVALPSSILRLQAERSKINTQIFSAQNQQKDAKEYFNYLVGRSAGEDIDLIPLVSLPDPAMYSEEIKTEELHTIDQGLRMQQLALDLQKKYHAPRLGAQLDVGSQNFNFQWGGYVLAGLQLDIPLWNNKKNEAQQSEVIAGMQAISEKKKYVSEGISLLLQQARRQLITAIDQYQSYTPLLDMSKRYYYEILKKFKEGQANPAELIDAQSQITFADLQQNVSLYQAWINAAELERLTLDKQ